MEFIPEHSILEYHSDTLPVVRKIYGFNNSREVGEAVNILQEWVEKQEHFVKKDYSKEYLERLLMACKGSVERAKVRLDKLCTFRTLLPHFFEEYEVSKHFKGMVTFYILPKLTEDYTRVILMKCFPGEVTSRLFLERYRVYVMLLEYLRAQDYQKSYMVIVDLRELNLSDVIPKINLIETHELMDIITKGYGGVLTGIHMLTTSKLIDMLVTLLKQMLSAKIGGRIRVHKTIESIYDYVPKDILPEDYGGVERSLSKLTDDWTEVFNSKEVTNYIKEMNAACTDESCRQSDKFNEQYTGMPGTFRTLTVD